ncbi:MAG: YidC/Oxa1 family membrane protein insertase [Tenericutes bacterium]|nr:YidC/Oxa1 family membrane protein insertase [Mycoplasmatota bacterium]
MKLRNKVLTTILMLVLLFGVASCGTKTGEISYGNFTNVVTVTEATEGTDPSSYNDVLILLGIPTNNSNYDTVTGDGYLEWENADDEYIKLTLEDEQVTAKESENLYENIYATPIGAKGGAWNWIILQLGKFTFLASSLFGLLGSTHLYWLGLLIMTLLVRTIGWPIYAKTNDMTLKMQVAQPELNKVQEKYRNKQDQASQQRMQMETMEIYKKYKINVFGCLLPLLQMPIFIAMYQVVQRFPLTDLTTFTSDSSVVMNIQFLWTTLGNTDWLPNLPFAILVGVLMFLSQWLTQHRTKVSQKHNNTYQNPKQQQSQNTMKYMMYFMVIFMAYISLRNAGIAFYWIIGTSYQLFQSYLSYKNMHKKQEQLKRQF